MAHHPLLLVLAKLERGIEHFNSIQTTVADFLENEFYETPSPFSGVYADRPNEWQILRWDGLREVPPRFGTMLGDLVHNVRSFLDHLVWQLVTLNEPSAAGKWTQFPISETEAKWRDDVTERDPKRGRPPTEGLSDEAFALVEAIQPFQPDRGGQDGPLYKLLRLSNDDKHRALHVGFLRSGGDVQGLRLEPRGYFLFNGIRPRGRGKPIENGAEIAEVRVRTIGEPPPGTQMQVLFDAPMETAFRNFTEDIAVSMAEMREVLETAEELLGSATNLPEVLAATGE